MKSVILDIFNGKRGNVDSIKAPEVDIKNSKLIDKFFVELENSLSGEMFKKIEAYTNVIDNHWYSEVEHYFVEGFKLGLLIGVECTKD